MPFGLNNVGGTYQRLMIVIKKMLDDTVEFYVDDLVIMTNDRSPETSLVLIR